MGRLLLENTIPVMVLGLAAVFVGEAGFQKDFAPDWLNWLLVGGGLAAVLTGAVVQGQRRKTT